MLAQASGNGTLEHPQLQLQVTVSCLTWLWEPDSGTVKEHTGSQLLTVSPAPESLGRPKIPDKSFDFKH